MKTKTAAAAKFYQLLFCLLLIVPAASQAIEGFSITSSSASSNDGSFNLSWKLPEATRIELQQAVILAGGNFKTVYTGSDTATVITGLSDGNYLFRARLIKQDGSYSEWTENTRLTVQHHSLTRAFSFFIIGAIVFLGTLILILSGTKTIRPQGDSS